MNERPSDFALLRDFTRHGSQPAFTALAERHLDLVYATALRRVEDSGGAEEIAQNVFSALARKAWRFAPDDSLPAWLHKTTLLESKFWIRGELRRRRREQTAAELGTTMKTPEDHAAFQALVPLLDDALLSLSEKDRTALLLRYYERHSLRDIGLAVCVSEDTAQKRVQRALERVAQFFSNRGFKTATVAATAAALQYTSAPASAALVSAVVTAASHSAPTALVGLGALLARLASLSRGQTATVCVALAALPLAWQLNQRLIAGQESKRIQAQYLSAQKEAATLQTEIDRLRARAAELNISVAQANEAATRAAQSAQAFEIWKRRIRSQLAAADYRWDDDSPFARIPKSVLRDLSKVSHAVPFTAPGTIEPYAREVLGLNPSERQELEHTLNQHFSAVEERLAAGIQQSEKAVIGRELAATELSIQAPVADEIHQHLEQTIHQLRDVLGEERWPLVQVQFNNNSFGLNSVMTQSAQQLSLWVETDDKGALKMRYGLQGELCTMGTGALSMFLPEGDPNRTEGADAFGKGWLSAPMRQRALAWLQEQAIVRVDKAAKQ